MAICCPQHDYSVAEVSAEKIIRGRTQEVADTTGPGFVGESAHNACRRTIQFPANQPSRRCKLISNGFDAGFKLVAVRIVPSAVVSQGLHSRDSDGELGQAFTPWTSKAIGVDHRNRNTGFSFQGPAQLAG